MISYLKDQYYWYNNYRNLKRFFKEVNEPKILIIGYPKSGNTWLRFLLYNYSSILLDNTLDKTITFEQLNSLQNNCMESGTTFSPEKGFPFIYRTHVAHKSSSELFDIKIFIHRNPLDTLISAHYFFKQRTVPFNSEPTEIREELNNIDFYIKYKIETWIEFYNAAVTKADFIISYTQLNKNAFKVLSKLIERLGWTYDEELIRKSIELSSFDKIKSMGQNAHQQYGNGPKDGSFSGEFVRSGKEGQYNWELKQETIDYVMRSFPDFYKLYV